MADRIVTLSELREAQKRIYTGTLAVYKTPLLQHAQNILPALSSSLDLYLKLESMQITGSFKLRGIANQFLFLSEEVKTGAKQPITMSAGNYGKAYAYALNTLGLRGMCLMPDTAPQDRVEIIKNYGTVVERVPRSDLQSAIEKHVEEDGYVFCHSYDDYNLIAGYGSAGLEIVDEGIVPDIVLVCCGGGGLVSGVAAAIKLSGLNQCKVYAVEPMGAPTMFESFRQGHPVAMDVKTVAAGLAPPCAGNITYSHCRKFVEDVILVSDKDIVEAVRILYQAGLVVEPSGAAAIAALVSGRVPDVAGKKVVAFITGRNIPPNELLKLVSDPPK
ncbi:hypothetical protein ScPMuIL_007529 [Solemya velum]